MQFSCLPIWAVFVLLLVLLLLIFLIAPIRISLHLRKEGSMIQGNFSLAWLGITMGRREIMPKSAGDLLAFIAREREGGKGPAGEAKLQEAGKSYEKGKKSTKTGILKPPKIHSVINALPAIKKIIRSIVFIRLSCCLCFGLDDPAQTAIFSGWLWSCASVLGLLPGCIFIEPFFAGEHLEGEVTAEIETRLLWSVSAFINAMQSREIRMLLRDMLGRQI